MNNWPCVDCITYAICRNKIKKDNVEYIVERSIDDSFITEQLTIEMFLYCSILTNYLYKYIFDFKKSYDQFKIELYTSVFKFNLDVSHQYVLIFA